MESMDSIRLQCLLRFNSPLLATCFLLVACLTYSSTLMMEVVGPSEALVNFYQSTLCGISEVTAVIISNVSIYS